MNNTAVFKLNRGFVLKFMIDKTGRSFKKRVAQHNYGKRIQTNQNTLF